MTVGLELGEELVEENHLPAAHDDVSEDLRSGVGFDLGALEEEGMVPAQGERKKEGWLAWEEVSMA
jgi:hypothetical protein